MVEGGKFIVETDFLFALRPSDDLHAQAKEALQRHQEGDFKLKVSGASPVEANAVMASQGLAEKEISEALSLMETDLASYGIDQYTKITISDIWKSSGFRQKVKPLTFFDSVHAALSARNETPLLSSNPIYKDLKIGWKNLHNLI